MNSPLIKGAEMRSCIGAKPHKYFVFTRSAESEPQLSLAAKSYQFFPTESEAKNHFEREPLCPAGEYFEAGWGVLSLSHGMTDWRRIEVNAVRKGVG